MDALATATPDEPVPADVQQFLDEPDKHGDLIDFLILVGIAVLLVMSLGAALYLIDSVWDMVGTGEGAHRSE